MAHNATLTIKAQRVTRDTDGEAVVLWSVQTHTGRTISAGVVAAKEYLDRLPTCRDCGERIHPADDDALFFGPDIGWCWRCR